MLTALLGRGDVSHPASGSRHANGDNRHQSNDSPSYLLDETSDRDHQSDADDDIPDLPLFSAPHLDSLPIFSLTRNLRHFILQRCETTLSWDQLRDPRISQFLVKPLQSHIRLSLFSRATLCALLINALQFRKEGQSKPGNVGVCETRASFAELLAIRLLKDYDPSGDLIDALSFDFDPLSGAHLDSSDSDNSRQFGTPTSASSRSSALEVAIRAQAKHFLCHRVVVEHLKQIWRGRIVFHAAADHLHRYPTRPETHRERHVGATFASDPSNRQSSPRRLQQHTLNGQSIRRSVTLYDPKSASPFKLSRLRVPIYRAVFWGLSYAVMLALFLAVLVERSPQVEIVFLVWSAGFILDELVGFSEQGFSLYLSSFWNSFDLGILALFFAYFFLRLCGFVVSHDYKERVASLAYDILSCASVLLFPRLFSFLDNYPYFSQLLIALKLMARDLAAVFVLVAISCSGFFVAFTFSFGQDDFHSRGTTYAFFQLIMGFTPVAWEAWNDFNFLGKLLLAIFLIMSHFLIVTLLVTVMTNSMSSVLQHADEEHAFLFAVNTISSVKSDALFSFIPPTNALGWLVGPLRYFMPFHDYVRLNRTIIKVTNVPALLLIYFYERTLPSRYTVEEDQVQPVQGHQGTIRRWLTEIGSQPRLRMPQETACKKERALEEVFKQPFDGPSANVKTPVESNGRTHQTFVDRWMTGIHDNHSSPLRSRSDIKQTRNRRSSFSKSAPPDRQSSGLSRSLGPFEDFPRSRPNRETDLIDLGDDGPAEADDELATPDDEEAKPSTLHELEYQSDKENQPERSLLRDEGKFVDPQSLASTIRPFKYSPATRPRHSECRRVEARMPHKRNSSNTTVLFNPLAMNDVSNSPSMSSANRKSRKPSRPTTVVRHPQTKSSFESFDSPSIRRPNQTRQHLPKPRPVMPTRYSAFNKSAPNLHTLLDPQSPLNPPQRAPSDILALDLNDSRFDGLTGPTTSTLLPGSLQTQMAMADAAKRRQSADVAEAMAEESKAMGRMLLSRMGLIEEGFRDMLKEVKEMKSQGPVSGVGEPSASGEVKAGSPKKRPKVAVVQESRQQ